MKNHEETIREAYARQLMANGEAESDISGIVDRHIINFKRSEILAYKQETGTDGTVPIKDLAIYVAEKYACADAEPGTEGRSLDLVIRIEGGISESNFEEYRALWLEHLDSVNLSPETDEEFAKAERFVKSCGSAEKSVKAALDEAVNGTVEISSLIQGVNELLEKMRETRLAVDKVVKGRKEQIRDEIIRAGEKRIADHISWLEAEFPEVAGALDCSVKSVADAAKGKRTVKTMRDAVDAEVGRLNEEAERLTDRCLENIGLIESSGLKSLFPDLKQLIKRPRQEVEAVIRSRLAEHELEQERIRQTELEKEVDKNTVEDTAGREYDLQSFMDDVSKKLDQADIEKWRKKHDKRIRRNLAPDEIGQLDAFCGELINKTKVDTGSPEEPKQKDPAENEQAQEHFIMTVEIFGTTVEAQGIARSFHAVIGENSAVNKVALKRA